MIDDGSAGSTGQAFSLGCDARPTGKKTDERVFATAMRMVSRSIRSFRERKT